MKAGTVYTMRAASVVFEDEGSEVSLISAYDIKSYPTIVNVLSRDADTSPISIAGVELKSFDVTEVCDAGKGWIITPYNNWAYRLCKYWFIDREGYQKRYCNYTIKGWNDIIDVGCASCDSGTKYYIKHNLKSDENLVITQNGIEIPLHQLSTFENLYSVCVISATHPLILELSSESGQAWSIDSYVQIESFSGTVLFKTTYDDTSDPVKRIVFPLSKHEHHGDYKYYNTKLNDRSWTEQSFSDSGWNIGNIYDVQSTTITTYIRGTFTITEHTKSLILEITYQDGCLVFINGNMLENLNIGANPSYTQEALTASWIPTIKTYILNPFNFNPGEVNVVAIEYHKKNRGQKDGQVFADFFIYAAETDEDLIRSYLGDVTPQSFEVLFNRDDTEYTTTCDPLPEIKYKFEYSQLVTHYEFLTGDLTNGTMTSWIITGVTSDGDNILLHNVEYYEFESNSKYRFSIQQEYQFASITIKVTSCKSNSFSFKAIHYIAGKNSTDCDTDTIWYRHSVDNTAQYPCSLFFYNKEGTVTRKCTTSGWSSIDYSKCSICSNNGNRYYISKSYDNLDDCKNEKFSIKDGNTIIYDNNDAHCEENMNNTVLSFCIANTFTNIQLSLSSVKNTWDYGSSITVMDYSKFPIIQTTKDSEEFDTIAFPRIVSPFLDTWNYQLVTTTSTTGSYTFPFYRFDIADVEGMTLKKSFTLTDLSQIRQVIVVVYTNGGYKMEVNGYEIGKKNYPTYI